MKNISAKNTTFTGRWNGQTFNDERGNTISWNKIIPMEASDYQHGQIEITITFTRENS